MTRRDLLDSIGRLYEDLRHNDVAVGKKLGVNNVTVRRWREATEETFRPSVENAIRIASAAGLDPFEALTAIKQADLAEFLRRAAVTHPVKGRQHDYVRTDDEQFLLSHYRKLSDQSPREAEAVLRLFEARIHALNQQDDSTAHPQRARRRRS